MKLKKILSTLTDESWPYVHRHIHHTYQSSTLEYRTWQYIYRRRSTYAVIALDMLQSEVGHQQSASSFRNVISRLSKSIEDAIVMYQLLHGKAQRSYQLILAKHYKYSGQVDLFDQSMQRSEVSEDLLASYDPLAALAQVEYHYEYVFSELDYGQKEKSYPQLTLSLSILKKNIDGLLELESINHNSPYNDTLNETAILRGQKGRLDSVLGTLHDMVASESGEACQTLSDIIAEDHKEMPGYLVQLVIMYINNFCYQRIRVGDTAYYQHLINNNDFGLEHEYLLSQGLISERRFINLVELKSYFGTDAEVLSFIDQWKERLRSKDVDPLLSLAHAFRFFGKDKYTECIDALHAVRISRSRYWLQLIKRWLTICALSTYPDHLHFAKELDAADKYFNRNQDKLPASLYRGSINLVKVLRMFDRGMRADQIQSVIDTMDVLVMRYWISQKIRKGMPST